MNEIELSIHEHEENCEHKWEAQVDFRGYSFGIDACLRCGKRREHLPHL